ELTQIDAPVASNAYVDVVGHRSEEAIDDLPKWWRSPHVDRFVQTRYPNVVKQRAEFQIVIRMMVCNENRAHLLRRNSGLDQLPCDTVSAIDHVRSVVDHHDICRTGAPAAYARPAVGAQQNQPGIVFRRHEQPPSSLVGR